MNLKHVLCQIQPYPNDLHDTPPSLQLTFEIPLHREGGVHTIATGDASRFRIVRVPAIRCSHVSGLEVAAIQPAEQILITLNIQVIGDNWRNRVAKGAVVKANVPADRSVRTYVRNEAGLLVDRSCDLARASIVQEPDDENLLLAVVAVYAKLGFPFTKSGVDSGFMARFQDLPESLRQGRNSLHGLADKLITKNLLTACRLTGKGPSKWLDVPGGPVARGEAHTPEGAPPHWEQITQELIDTAIAEAKLRSSV